MHPSSARQVWWRCGKVCPCGRFVASGAVGFTSLKDKGGLAVEAYVFGDGFGAAQVGEEGEGDGRCDRWSRRGGQQKSGRVQIT